MSAGGFNYCAVPYEVGKKYNKTVNFIECDNY